MKRYLNRLEKQQALSIASFEAYLDDRVEEYVEAGKSKELLRNLRTAKTFLHKALENIMAPLDKREVVKLLAEIRKMQVVVVYKTGSTAEVQRDVESGFRYACRNRGLPRYS